MKIRCGLKNVWNFNWMGNVKVGKNCIKITFIVFTEQCLYDRYNKGMYSTCKKKSNTISLPGIRTRSDQYPGVSRRRCEVVVLCKNEILIFRHTHRNNWIKRDKLDVTCFFISLFNAQHVSDVNTSVLRSLRLMCWVISWVVLLWFDVCWCYVVVWLKH